jgi:hypothetical protein
MAETGCFHFARAAIGFAELDAFFATSRGASDQQP